MRPRRTGSCGATAARAASRPNEIGARADSLVRDVRDIDGDVLLFAHGHILRVITARWLGYPPNDGMHFSLGTATLSILGSEREAPSIWRWNAP